jgi:hypothetical protein
MFVHGSWYLGISSPPKVTKHSMILTNFNVLQIYNNSCQNYIVFNKYLNIQAGSGAGFGTSIRLAQLRIRIRNAYLSEYVLAEYSLHHPDHAPALYAATTLFTSI